MAAPRQDKDLFSVEMWEQQNKMLSKKLEKRKEVIRKKRAKPKSSVATNVQFLEAQEKLKKHRARRRAQCLKCANCLRENCLMCSYCLDMTRYGGPGRLKQRCKKRQCLNPVCY